MASRRFRIPIQLPVILVLLGLSAYSIYRWRVDQRGDPDHLTVSGTVEANQVAVGSKVGGRLVELLVREGDVVQRGQLVARFDDGELAAQIRQTEASQSAATAQEQKLRNGPRAQELAQARAAVDVARAQLNELLAGSRSEDIAATKAAWQAAEAQATQASADYARAQQLYAQAVLPRSDLDAAKARADSTRRTADAAHEQYVKAQAGPRPTQIEAARAQVRQAQAAYDLLAAGARPEDIAAARSQVELAVAQKQQLQTRAAETKVFAPEPGVVLTLDHQAGDLVAPSQPVLDLLLTDSYFVQVFVPENKLGWAQPGMTARVTVDTYPGETFSGTVTYLATAGEYTPRNLQTTEKRVEQTFRCKLRLDDPSARLRPGMVCDVVFDRPGGVSER